MLRVQSFIIVWLFRLSISSKTTHNVSWYARAYHPPLESRTLNFRWYPKSGIMMLSLCVLLSTLSSSHMWCSQTSFRVRDLKSIFRITRVHGYDATVFWRVCLAHAWSREVTVLEHHLTLIYSSNSDRMSLSRIDNSRITFEFDVNHPMIFVVWKSYIKSITPSHAFY